MSSSREYLIQRERRADSVYSARCIRLFYEDKYRYLSVGAVYAPQGGADQLGRK